MLHVVDITDGGNQGHAQRGDRRHTHRQQDASKDHEEEVGHTADQRQTSAHEGKPHRNDARSRQFVGGVPRHWPDGEVHKCHDAPGQALPERPESELQVQVQRQNRLQQREGKITEKQQPEGGRQQQGPEDALFRSCLHVTLLLNKAERLGPPGEAHQRGSDYNQSGYAIVAAGWSHQGSQDTSQGGPRDSTCPNAHHDEGNDTASDLHWMRDGNPRQARGRDGC
mmetsp:Transcript_40560/g.72588  ORF Transcript_40560/g.72588 Transcript_40560/m.72588 type:complete len:225 (+) Transcript_40560:786-1460(+)